MYMTLMIAGGTLFALLTGVASLRGDTELIAHRPYENVHGTPRSARSTTHLDM